MGTLKAKTVVVRPPELLRPERAEPPIAPAIDAVPVPIRRAVLEKQLENYQAQAADQFGAYEVHRTVTLNTRGAQQSFQLMNQALAAAARVKELIADLPTEATNEQK